MVTINRRFFLSLAVTSCLVGCSSVDILSSEEPYSSMVGECFILKQDMQIRGNICWELGDLILTPKENAFCLRESIGEVKKETRLHITQINQKYSWGTGYCPQISVNIESVEIDSGDIFLPLCFVRKNLSWLKDGPVWRRGDEIQLRSEYAVPCDKID